MTPSQHLSAASRTSITHCTPGQDIFSCVYDDDDNYNDEDGDNDEDGNDDDDDADLGKTLLAPSSDGSHLVLFDQSPRLRE